MQEEEEATAEKRGGVRREAAEALSERLSHLETLYFPRALQPSAASPTHRKSLLLDLLSRDVAVFLERYGTQLTFDELTEFDMLKDDYEISWHLNHIRSLNSPTTEELKSRSKKVKNRRRAYLDKLISGGQYFTEDAMREREPYLHHEYVGKFQDLSGRRMARPGERWSETLIRRAEEAFLVQKIRGEQQRLGVAESDWIGNEREEQDEQVEEEEEEDDSEDENMANDDSGEGDSGSERPLQMPSNNGGDVNNDQSIPEGHAKETTLSSEEMQDRMDQFTHIMKQKFLEGEDLGHLDYSKIDNDETLDDHWLKEANQDAEEKYFDDD